MHLDWVAVRLTLAHPTQVRHLRAALPTTWANGGAAPYVEAAGDASSHTDWIFTLRVQDPAGPAHLRADLSQLAARFPFASSPAVSGLEVAFDAFAPASCHPQALADMAEHLFRGLTDPPSTNRRITGPKGTRGLVESASVSRGTNRMRLDAGQSLAIGNSDDARSVRVYVKADDTGQRWARLENTLIGTACPFADLDGWAGFEWDRLAHLFRWRRTSESKGLRAVLADWRPALASPVTADHRSGHRRATSHATEADRDLSDEARKALRRLTTAQRKG